MKVKTMSGIFPPQYKKNEMRNFGLKKLILIILRCYINFMTIKHISYPIFIK